MLLRKHLLAPLALESVPSRGISGRNVRRVSSLQPSNLTAHPRDHTVPYGTALLGWRCPRHFVPGYDRTVPPGQAVASVDCPVSVAESTAGRDHRCPMGYRRVFVA